MSDPMKINPWSDLEDSFADDSQNDNDSETAIELFKSSLRESTAKKKEPRSEIEQAKKKHLIHTYVRHDRRKDIFRCAHKYCYHMTEKSLLLGKANICRCGNEFILSKEDLRRKWPRCPQCSNSKKTLQVARATDVSKKIFEQLEKQAEVKQIALNELTVRREED